MEVSINENAVKERMEFETEKRKFCFIFFLNTPDLFCLLVSFWDWFISFTLNIINSLACLWQACFDGRKMQTYDLQYM